MEWQGVATCALLDSANALLNLWHALVTGHGAELGFELPMARKRAFDSDSALHADAFDLFDSCEDHLVQLVLWHLSSAKLDAWKDCHEKRHLVCKRNAASQNQVSAM